MTEEKPVNEQPMTPYDLWPTEEERAEAAASAQPVYAGENVDAFTDLPSTPFQSPVETPFLYENKVETPFDAPFVPVAYTPETSDEAVRQRGLAFSVGVVFFGSVAFMLFLGWLADLLLGSSPWGIVAGIILGAIIGFLQFFRITSQIFNNSGDTPKQNPLSSHHDDEK
jgi:F0F1-type ATP synthase assembly protein I